MKAEAVTHIVDGIKRELGASPSDMFTTAPSSLLRDAVRALDETYTPHFKPEGEYDYYRDQWAKIDPASAPPQDYGGTIYALRIERRDSDGTPSTHFLNLNSDQAYRILTMLGAENGAGVQY